MKNLFKKILACCLVVCMVFTLCISAVTVSAEEATFDGTLTIGNAEVAAGAKEATVSFAALAEKDGIAAAEVNVTLPAGATGISKVELDTTDENVEVIFFKDATGDKPVTLPDISGEEDVLVYEGDVNIIENVFSYILWVNNNADVTTVATTVEITFVGDFKATAPVTAAIEACKDDVDLLNLEVKAGAINVATHVHSYTEEVTTKPTCTEPGVKTFTCTCGEGTYTESIDALGHAYGTPVDNGDGTHTATCANDAAHTETVAHNFVDGKCVCGAVEKVACEHANKTLIEATPASSEGPGLLDYDCPDCDDDDSIDITVTYKSDLMTFVTPAISCEATTILRLKTVKTTNLSAYTDGLLVTTHNYQNGATATTNSYNMSNIPVVSSRYQLDIPVIYTQFTDIFDCALYLEKDGIWYSNGITAYSLKDVAMTYVNSESTEDKYRYTAANLLKVGAAAQTEFGYAKTNLADSELVGSSYVINEVPNFNCEDGVNFTGVPADVQTAGKVFYVTPGVLLSDSTAITIKANKAFYSGDELNNLKLEYSYTKENGAQKTGKITEFDTDNKGRLLFTLGLDAPDMRSVITFKLYNGDTQVADDAVFSIEGSLASYYNSGSYTDVIERVMIYSDVVATYF